MADKISGRLQTPKDAYGNRKDIHLITTTDEVLAPDGRPMTEHIREVIIQIGTTKPTFPCMWFNTTTK